MMLKFLIHNMTLTVDKKVTIIQDLNYGPPVTPPSKVAAVSTEL